MAALEWLISLILTAVSAFSGAFLGVLAQQVARSVWHRIAKKPMEYIPALGPGQAAIVRIGGKYYEAINRDGRIELIPVE